MCAAVRLFVSTTLLLAALTLPAAAQEAAAEQPMSLTPSDGPPETVVTASGSGCTIGTRLVTVRLTDLGAVLGSAETTADAEGRWETTLRIPRSTAPGEYTVGADCEDTLPYVEQRLDVLEAGEDAAPAAADIGEESRTDTELLLLGALGGLLLAGGIVLVVADRRRRAARNVRA